MKLTKTIISSLAIIVSACVGCSNDVDFDATDAPMTYISFDQPKVTFGSPDVNTRASLTTTDDLAEFTVSGFCVPQNVTDINKLDYSQASAPWGNKAKFCRPNVFDSGTAIVKKTGSSWKYENLKKWVSPFDTENVQYASEAKFTFIAWANGDFSMDSFTSKEAPKLRFSLPFSGGTENNPVNCDHALVKDALIAETYDHEAIEGKVPLHFHHILTGIRFRIANHSNDDLTIKSMKFKGNFFGKATFTYEKSTLDQDVDRVNGRYWGSFTIVNSSKPELVPANNLSRIIGSTNEDPDGLTLLLLPDPDVDPTNPNDVRNALGDNKKIEITYILEGKEYTAEIEVSLTYIPEQSTRHTATFHFLGKNQFYVIFKPKSDVWENGSDDTLTIN